MSQQNNREIESSDIYHVVELKFWPDSRKTQVLRALWKLEYT